MFCMFQKLFCSQFNAAAKTCHICMRSTLHAISVFVKGNMAHMETNIMFDFEVACGINAHIHTCMWICSKGITYHKVMDQNGNRTNQSQNAKLLDVNKIYLHGIVPPPFGTICQPTFQVPFRGHPDAKNMHTCWKIINIYGCPHFHAHTSGPSTRVHAYTGAIVVAF